MKDQHEPAQLHRTSQGTVSALKGTVSRRNVLVALGVAGAALASGTLAATGRAASAFGAATVSESVYGGGENPTCCEAFGVVNVQDYGAVGDGVADDTQAFQDAAATGKTVLVPKTGGFYKLSAPVSLSASLIGIDMPEIRMDGADGTANKRMFLVMFYQGGGLHIAGLRMNGQYAGGTLGEQSHCIRIIHSSNVYVHHNVLERPYGDCVCIGSDYIAPCENIHVYDNELLSPRRCAVAIGSCKKAWIRNNTIHDPFVYVASIDLEPNKTTSGSDIVEDVWIEGNAFYSEGLFINSLCPNNGFKNRRFTIRGNHGRSSYFFRCNSNDVGNTEDVLITDNIYYGSVGSSRMFSISKIVKGLKIQGNKDFGTGSSGWYIANAFAPVICHNHIEAARSIALSFWNCERVLFSGNVIKDVYSPYGAVRFVGDSATEGHMVTSNAFVHTDYSCLIGAAVANTTVDGNQFDAERFAVQIEAAAAGSDVRILPGNVFVGNGSPVGSPERLTQARSPDVLVKGATVSWANAVPASGDWVRGSIVYNALPSAPGVLGWVCVSGGSPGTWELFGAIG